MIMNKLFWVALIIIFQMAFPKNGLAWEGGKSLWQPGFPGTMTGFLPPQGVYFNNRFFFYSGNVGARVEGRLITTNVQADALADMMGLTYVTKYKPAGGQFGMSAVFPAVIHVNLSGDVVTPNMGSIHREKGVTGIGDLYLAPFILGWHSGNFHYLWDVGVYLPTGKYSELSIVNIGKNRFGFQTDFGFTYFDPKLGPQVNVYTGFVVPLVNSSTDYQSGADWHMDYSGLYVWPFRLAAGVQGYIQQQITADSGSGALLGAFKGRLLGIGPVISYDARIKTFNLNLNVRYFHEFLTKNTFSGDGLWFSFGFGF
jgi:hypothetical protein